MTSIPRLRRWLLVLAGALTILALWFFWPRTQPDPLPDSPWLNTRAEVRYVGDAACALCHLEIVERYRQHPMGQSLAPISETPRERPGQFNADGYRYEVETRGGQLIHGEIVLDEQGKPLVQTEAAVSHAIGSGRQGRSFLLERDGFVFQSPISWFRENQAWGLSPGFAGRGFHFDRGVAEACLHCHANEVESVPQTFNRYRPPVFRGHAIGCERCHGPGELHVARWESGEASRGVDTTIVNPARLEPTLRESVCQQCHLQGESRVSRRGRSLFDYRPGLPLSRFLSVFVRPPEQLQDRKAVSHTEQMVVSTCFRQSEGKLGCISCHDPHSLPAEKERLSFYRARCQKCHEEKPCAEPLAVRRQRQPDDSCLACHMPRNDSSNIAHASVTDHRIPRRPEAWVAPKTGRGQPGLPLVPFHEGPTDPRDLGVALAEVARNTNSPVRRALCELAVPLLESALDQNPDDFPVLEALGYCLSNLGRTAEAMAVLRQALEQAPQAERALEEAGYAAQALKQLDEAETFWRRYTQATPHRPHGYVRQAQLRANRRDWSQTQALAQQALQYEPTHTVARALLVSSCFELDQLAEGKRNLRILERLEPSLAQELRKQYPQAN